MAAAQVTKQDLEISRCWAIIHDVSFQTKPKDIENAVRQRVGRAWFTLKLNKLFQNGGKTLRNVSVNFNDKEGVDALMDNRPFIVNRETLMLSRSNPKTVAFAGQPITTISVMICGNEKKELAEHDLKWYFQPFGRIKAYKRLNDEQILMKFEDYDSVDRIILHAVTHTIRETKVIIQKTGETISGDDVSHSIHTCIHVTNMPADITSNELSLLFGVHVANILLQPGNQLNEHLVVMDRSPSEAWIKDTHNRQDPGTLASRMSGKRLCGWEIVCNVIDEPFDISELCIENEKGACPYPAHVCFFKHRPCRAPNTCADRDCWFGHSRQRLVSSNPRDKMIRGRYRLRIGNVSPSTTEEQLMERLGISLRQKMNIRFPERTDASLPMVVYLVHQLSERFLRNIIGAHHNKPFSESITAKLQLQLEKNVDFYQWNDKTGTSKSSRRSSVSSVASIPAKPAPWCNGSGKTASQASPKVHSEDRSSTNPARTSRKINERSDPIERPLATIERLILEKLAGLDSVPKLSTHHPGSIDDLHGMTLREYLKQHPVNMHRVLTIALNLLTIVKAMHSRNVVHRDLNPDNIIVTSSDADSLVVTNFASATLIDRTEQDHYQFPKDNYGPIDSPARFFYRTPQMAPQPTPTAASNATSPTIDASHICAILFWLITHTHPKDSRDINDQAPHEKKKASSEIDTAVEKATGTFTGISKGNLLSQHLRLIFDRGFADADHQWSIEELEYQIRFVLQLTINDRENSGFPSPCLTKDKQISTSVSELNSFFRLATLIAEVKDQLQQRYPDILWQKKGKTEWIGDDQQVVHHLTVVFQQPIHISAEMLWKVEIDKAQKLRMTMNVMMNDKLAIVLPVGMYEEDMQNYLSKCEIQLKNLFDILYEDRKRCD